MIPPTTWAWPGHSGQWKASGHNMTKDLESACLPEIILLSFYFHHEMTMPQPVQGGWETWIKAAWPTGRPAAWCTAAQTSLASTIQPQSTADSYMRPAEICRSSLDKLQIHNNKLLFFQNTNFGRCLLCSSTVATAKIHHLSSTSVPMHGSKPLPLSPSTKMSNKPCPKPY